MVGTGALAPFLIEAHAANRPIDQLMIFGRNQKAAEALADRFKDRFNEVSVVDNLSNAVPNASIISVATLSYTPLIEGSWLRPGSTLILWDR